MANPRRLADYAVYDSNGIPLSFPILRVNAQSIMGSAVLLSSAAAALPGDGSPPGAQNIYQLLTNGPCSIRFGNGAVPAAVAFDATGINLLDAGLYFIDAGLTATHFRIIRIGLVDASWILTPLPTRQEAGPPWG